MAVLPEGVLPQLLEDGLPLAKVAEVLQKLSDTEGQISFDASFPEALFMLGPHSLNQALEDLVRSRVLRKGLELLEVQVA